MRVTIAVLVFIALMGRNSYAIAVDIPLPQWRGYEISAVATPWGPIYFGESMYDPQIRQHEWCHIQRMKKIGTVKFLYRYSTDRAWACQEERICGWTGVHPMCRVDP